MSYKNSMPDKDIETLIESVCETDEGRRLLADSMCISLRCGGMGYHNNVAYIIHGGYPWPERALAALREIAKAYPGALSEWMNKYREMNDRDPELRETSDHWDYLEHRDDPDHFPTFSLWDTKRAIRDFLDAEKRTCLKESSLSCECEHCAAKHKAKSWMTKAGKVP
jgi:hypothetical protein